MNKHVPSLWELDGWRIRLEPGRKGEDDVRIWVGTPGGSECLMRLSTLGAIARLWYQNEERLYNKPWQEGGERVLRFLRDCCERDTVSACELHKLKPPRIVQLDQDEAA